MPRSTTCQSAPFRLGQAERQDESWRCGFFAPLATEQRPGMGYLIVFLGAGIGGVSLVVEYSLIVGTENSLAGALARGSGARPRNPGLSHFADHTRRRDSDGGGDSGPAGRTHDDFGPSPPGPVCHGDCATYGA